MLAGLQRMLNLCARIQPRRDDYLNAIQVYPYSEGALYQVYSAPGEITVQCSPRSFVWKTAFAPNHAT